MCYALSLVLGYYGTTKLMTIILMIFIILCLQCGLVARFAHSGLWGLSAIKFRKRRTMKKEQPRQPTGE